MEMETEVEIPEEIKEQATSVRQRLERLVCDLQVLEPRLLGVEQSLDEIIIDVVSLEEELSKPISHIVEIEPPEYDEP